jgi:hypothetical protein
VLPGRARFEADPGDAGLRAEHLCGQGLYGFADLQQPNADGVKYLWYVAEDDPDSGLYAESPDADTVIGYITAHAQHLGDQAIRTAPAARRRTRAAG